MSSKLKPKIGEVFLHLNKNIIVFKGINDSGFYTWKCINESSYYINITKQKNIFIMGHKNDFSSSNLEKYLNIKPLKNFNSKTAKILYGTE